MADNWKSVDVFYYCYNQENFIARALDSIIAQSGPLILNIIVCDDASTDSSLRNLEKWIDDNGSTISGLGWSITNISHSPNENLGQVATLKEGISKCKSEYFAVLEGDDYWFGINHLEEAISVLSKNKFLTSVFSSWISLHGRGSIKEVRTPGNREYAERLFDFDKLISFNAPGTLSCMVYRVSALKTIKSYIENDSNLSDFSLNLTISSVGPIFWLDNLSVHYTFDPDSLWRKIPLREQRLQTAGIIRDRVIALEMTENENAGRVIAYLEQTRYQEIKSFLFKHPVKFMMVLVRKLYRKIL